MFNILVHTVNTYLVYKLIRSSFRTDAPPTKVSAAFGSALFAFHPVQVESVAWISGGRDILSTLFALLAISYFLKNQTWTIRLLSLTLFLIGLLSKPHIAALPLAILIYIFLFQRQRLKQTFFDMTIWSILVICLSVYTFYLQSPAFQSTTSLWQKPLIMIDTYGFYLKKLVLPTQLSADYGRSPSYIFAHLQEVLLHAFILVGAIWYIVNASKKDKRFKIIWSWFVILLPISGVVYFGFQDISTVTDHYLYFSISIIATCFSVALDKIPRQYAFFLNTLLLIFWLSQDLKRIDIWKSDTQFFSDILTKNPSSFSANIGLGLNLCQSQSPQQVAMSHIERALSIEPKNPMGLAAQVQCLAVNQDWVSILKIADTKFSNYELRASLELNEILAAEVYSSFASAAWMNSQPERAFFYICQAFWRNGIAPHIQDKLRFILGKLNKTSNSDCPARIKSEYF